MKYLFLTLFLFCAFYTANAQRHRDGHRHYRNYRTAPRLYISPLPSVFLNINPWLGFGRVYKRYDRDYMRGYRDGQSDRRNRLEDENRPADRQNRDRYEEPEAKPRTYDEDDSSGYFREQNN